MRRCACASSGSGALLHKAERRPELLLHRRPVRTPVGQALLARPGEGATVLVVGPAPAATGASGDDEQGLQELPDSDCEEQIEAAKRALRHDLDVDFLDRTVRMGLDALEAKRHSAFPMPSFLDAALGADAGKRVQTEHVWSSALRELAIGTDRSYVFFRTVAGLLGESVDALLVKDPGAEEREKRLQERRDAIAKRVSDAASKIIEILVAGLTSASKLHMSRDAKGALVIIDGQTRQEMQALARGETAKMFFDSSVTLRNLATAEAEATQLTLGQVLEDVNAIAESLERTLLASSVASAGISSHEASLPRNCQTMLVRPDVLAAIGSAFDRVAHRPSMPPMTASRCGVGGPAQRKRGITLYELIEGPCDQMTERFAEVVAMLLSATRARPRCCAPRASPDRPGGHQRAQGARAHAAPGAHRRRVHDRHGARLGGRERYSRLAQGPAGRALPRRRARARGASELPLAPGGVGPVNCARWGVLARVWVKLALCKRPGEVLPHAPPAPVRMRVQMHRAPRRRHRPAQIQDGHRAPRL